MNWAIPTGVAWLCFGAAFGYMAGGWDRTGDLEKCQRHWHACDLTAEGNTLMIADTGDRLQVCELGMEAADMTIDKINDAAVQTELELTLCRARAKNVKGRMQDLHRKVTEAP